MLEKFWDVFQYSDAYDPLLDTFGWHIAQGENVPPAGAIYLKDNIVFTDESIPDGRVMTLTVSTDNEFSELTGGENEKNSI